MKYAALYKLSFIRYKGLENAMKYNNVCKANFISRPNRFVAHVLLDGEETVVHVKNTGRCKELLIPGCTVYLEQADNPNRKTQYDLIAVEKNGMLINMDSQAPNKVVEQWLRENEPFGKIIYLKPEAVHGKSRFDFYLETVTEKMFIEVKGVTLEENGVVMFPDAPTLRGLKHIEELEYCLQEGYSATIIFVVQMRGVKYFTPNAKTQPKFAAALAKAEAAGVKVVAMDCEVSPDTLKIREEVPVQNFFI